MDNKEKFMDRNLQRKTSLVIVLVVTIVAITVAFAALSSQLKIQGTASVPNVRWNIHFQNWALDTSGTVDGHQNTAVYPQVNQLTQTISVANSTKVEGINVTLKQPGDYVKYTFQIINEGTIDATLDNFVRDFDCAAGNNCDHIVYTIECKDANDNNVLVGNPTLAKNGGLAYCSLEVKYDDQTNNHTAGENQVYTQAAATVTIGATWTYIQKVAVISGSGSGSGSEPSGGSEPGSGEQGGGSGSGSSGSEPTAQTWDTYYTYQFDYYDDRWGDVYSKQEASSPENEFNVWLQENSTTKQACALMGGDVVCINHGGWDCGTPYDSDSDGYYDKCSNPNSYVESLYNYYKDLENYEVYLGANNFSVEKYDPGYTYDYACRLDSPGDVMCKNYMPEIMCWYNGDGTSECRDQ